ncbi:malonyl-ACP O-methyltransferase BioC [Thaumasiovibrio sp. DFM-14]|uniref:malonyl-ACP O-methyltransferase BioC n=1 Tax=Thaumasiovibrio sp. DFM-14 TaxID=3384792 RepID=UPI0039A3E2D1
MLKNTEQKRAIAQAFGRAAQSYDNSAEFQRIVGEQLLAKIPHYDMPQRVLDVGCGTGYFSAELIKQGHQVTCLDLSEAMLAQARTRCGEAANYLTADADHLPIQDNSVDIAFSSLALQWCTDLSVPLAELRRVVRPGGIIAFSTLAEGSLFELANAWRQVDNLQHINEFLSEKLIKIALAQAKLNLKGLEFNPIVQYYSCARDLMRDLKGIGATHLHQQRKSGLLSRRALAELETAYMHYRHSNGLLPATYQVCFGVIVNE